jgi:hypothetical protein
MLVTSLSQSWPVQPLGEVNTRKLIQRKSPRLISVILLFSNRRLTWRNAACNPVAWTRSLKFRRET